MENLKLPLVLVVALGAQLAGAVFWGANVLRDINDNTARTDELIEILLFIISDLLCQWFGRCEI